MGISEGELNRMLREQDQAHATKMAQMKKKFEKQQQDHEESVKLVRLISHQKINNL